MAPNWLVILQFIAVIVKKEDLRFSGENKKFIDIWGGGGTAFSSLSAARKLVTKNVGVFELGRLRSTPLVGPSFIHFAVHTFSTNTSWIIAEGVRWSDDTYDLH
jgi:hypothetical protein